MGKPVEKHPCLNCKDGVLNDAGTKVLCKNADFTDPKSGAWSFKDGRGMTSRTVPKWCPRGLTEDDFKPSKVYEFDADTGTIGPEVVDIEQEQEEETTQEKSMDNAKIMDKLKEASDKRKQLGSIVYRFDLQNREKALERSDEMADIENGISEALMNALDLYDEL